LWLPTDKDCDYFNIETHFENSFSVEQEKKTCNEEREGVTFSGYKFVTSENRPNPTSMKYVLLIVLRMGEIFQFPCVSRALHKTWAVGRILKINYECNLISSYVREI